MRLSSVTERVSLCKNDDAVRLITERLRVKEVGPADHIRTKHEVMAFVEFGNLVVAESLLKRSQERLGIGRTVDVKVTQGRGYRA